MGLWIRMKRSMRAVFGGIIEKTEDPELILQQTIRDMRDRVPELNNSVAQVMATEKLLAKNKERLESQVVDLDSKIRASVKMGRDDIATAYIGQLQQAQVDLQKTSQQRKPRIETSTKSTRQLCASDAASHCRSDAVDKSIQAGEAAGATGSNHGVVPAWR
jgi:phage shock protein A